MPFSTLDISDALHRTSYRRGPTSGASAGNAVVIYCGFEPEHSSTFGDFVLRQKLMRILSTPTITDAVTGKKWRCVEAEAGISHSFDLEGNRWRSGYQAHVVTSRNCITPATTEYLISFPFSSAK